ncbi:MAG: glucose-6-phosphate dehydrogenase [Mycobacterium sp.]|nr:glucose-6-phosphate dehydrogenase [Mycobacterium sp.]
MSDRLFNYVGEILCGCLDVDLASAAMIGAEDFAKFLTDDVRLHVIRGHAAAAEWGIAEHHGPVQVTATHLVITEHGLVFAAEVGGPNPSYYLAAPRALLEPVADHIADSRPLLGAAAAVDCRMGHDLASIWQFEHALRHRLDADPVIRVQLIGAFAA